MTTQSLAIITRGLVGRKADVAQIPVASTATPSAEKVGGNAGTDPQRFAMEGHQHPRLTSTTGATAVTPNSHTIGSDGLSAAIMFTRSFSFEPGIDIMPIKPNASDILLPPYVSDWVMGTGVDAGKYVGVIIGWKKLQMSSTAVTILNISVLASQTPTQVAATGVRFSCIAIARSDLGSN